MIEASEYNKCVRCGLCLPTCPTYLETMTETSGPRGRISLIRSVDEGTLDVLSPGFVHQMSECLDCRACSAVCPSGVQYGQLVEGARARIALAQAPRRGVFSRLARTLVFGVLFGKLWLMRALAHIVRFAQQTGLQTFARRLGLLRILGLAHAETLAPPLAKRFFVPRDQRFAADAERAVVMLHAGCVMQVAFSSWHEATVRVLRRNGFTVLVPAQQGCCGAIAVHAGEDETARAFARRNIEAFERSGAEFCVINAAGCGAALKEYGHLLKDDSAWAQRAQAFSSKVRDVLEFLDAQGLREAPGALDAVISYQDPCHLAHAQRVTAAPRRLLGAIRGITLREMPESSVCCGSAGIYNLTQPEMSERLGKRKAQNAAATNADVIATANPGCAMQMTSYLRAQGTEIPVRHVVEVLDAAYAAKSKSGA